jgi:hypothetical protein
MKRIGTTLAMGMAFAGSSAQAGIYADDLSKCLVGKASQADQTVFMQWIFSALSASPAVKEMSATTDAQHAKYNKLASQLMSRLLFKDCREQSVAALKYEGYGTLETGFGVLGQVAVRGLMTDPAVLKQLQGLGTEFDEPAMKALVSEAGLPQAEPKK